MHSIETTNRKQKMAKTPAKIVELLKNHSNMMAHITEVLRVKRLYPDNQASHIASHSEEYYIGMADGYNHALEDALMKFKCYNGFHYQGTTASDMLTLDGEKFYQTIGTLHPEFAEWRRKYYIKG